MTKQRIRRGFTFRDPKGNIDFRVHWSVEEAQSQAAFDWSPRCGITLPDDWNSAYKAGYRIVPVALAQDGRARPSWKNYVHGNE